MQVFAYPAHFGDVNKSLDTGFQFDERSVISDVGNGAVDTGPNLVFRFNGFPRIGFKLLHAKRNTLGFEIDPQHLHFHRVTHIDDVAWVIDAPPGHVGDMQKAVDAAQVDKGAIIGNVFHHAFDNLAFFQLGDDFRPQFGTCLFQNSAA